jgi:hypothetical protein
VEVQAPLEASRGFHHRRDFHHCRDFRHVRRRADAELKQAPRSQWPRPPLQ